MSNLAQKPTKRNPPFYFYENKGWKIDTKVKVNGVYKRLSKGYYRSIGEARADFNNQVEALALRSSERVSKHKDADWWAFVDAFIDYRRSQVRGSSLEIDKRRIRSLFNPIFGDRPIDHCFTAENAERFQKAVKNANINRKNKNKALSMFLAMLEYAFDHGYLKSVEDYRACKCEITMIRSTEQDDVVRERQVLTSEQCQALLDSILDPADKMLTATLMFMGLRIGEALALRGSDFDFNKQELSITRTVSIDEFGQWKEYNRTKTALGQRVIPLSADFCRIAQEYMAIRGLRGSDLMFPSYDNPQKPMDGSAFRRRLASYCGKAGVPSISPHCLRHTFATLLSQRCTTDADRQARAYVMGHSVAVDEATYTAHNRLETAKKLLG